MKFLVAIILLAISGSLFSQQFGGNPPSLKWSQVNNAAARIIYPTGLDSVALQVAGIVQKLNSVTQQSIGNKQHKVDIVLHNFTTVSNAYVALGPYRSEFYLGAPSKQFYAGQSVLAGTAGYS